MTSRNQHELKFNFLLMSLTARGWAALALAVPVAMILLAVAYRIWAAG